MGLTPWNRRDTKDFVITTKRILDMIIAGSFAGLIVNPIALSFKIFFGLCLVLFSSYALGYFFRRM